MQVFARPILNRGAQLLLLLLASHMATAEEVYRFERMWPELSRWWNFSSLGGIAVDGDGNIYIADKDLHTVQKSTSDGVHSVSWGTFGGEPGQFRNPLGVAVDSLGSVYVADSGNQRVQKFTSDGTYLTDWGSMGDQAGQFGLPLGLAVDAAGSVYVADYENDRIQKFTSDGVYVTGWGGTGSEAGELDSPYDIVVDAAGYVYVAEVGNSRIQKFTSDGAYVTCWGERGDALGQFVWPRGLAVDSEENLYVADAGNNRIQTFTFSGAYAGSWGSYGSQPEELSAPSSVSLDDAGYVYVADYGNDRIQKFTTEGVHVTSWGNTGGEAGEFNFPNGVAVDESGCLYVTDTWNKRIQKFSSDGGHLLSWWQDGAMGVAVDSAGNVYATDCYGHRICKFTADGAHLASWGSAGTESGQLNQPAGISVDGAGFVYVADWGNDRIQKFSLEGAHVASWGSTGSEPGQFESPADVAVGLSGDVYVADRINNRIQRFTSDGAFLAAWGNVGGLPGEFLYPQGVDVDEFGCVYVSDTYNNRIQKFTADGAYVASWGMQGTDQGEFNLPHGVAVDETGRVYVVDTGNTRIQRFVPMGENTAPQIALCTPPAGALSATTNDTYTIEWGDADPDDDARIDLYYDDNADWTDNPADDGAVIALGLSEDDETDQHDWDLSSIPEGTYYVHAVISDGTNDPVHAYSPGTLRVDAVPPLSIALTLSNGQELSDSQVLVVGDDDGTDDAIRITVDTEYEGVYSVRVRVTLRDPDSGHTFTEMDYTWEEAPEEVSVPLLPTCNNAEHRIWVGVTGRYNGRGFRTEESAVLRVAPHEPDMVIVTNPDVLQQRFEPEAYASEGPDSGPSVLQLLQAMALDGGVFFYTCVSDPDRAGEIRAALDDALFSGGYGIGTVALLGAHDVVPMGCVTIWSPAGSRSGYGDYPFWSMLGSTPIPQWECARLPFYSTVVGTMEIDPERGSLRRAMNYSTLRRCFIENGAGDLTPRAVALQGSRQLYLSAQNDPQEIVFNFALHVEGMRAKLGSVCLADTVHHGDGLLNESVPDGFIPTITMLYAAGHGSWAGVGDKSGDRAILRSQVLYLSPEHNVSYRGFAVEVSGEYSFDPAAYEVCGGLPGTLYCPYYDASRVLTVRRFENFPLAAAVACATCESNSLFDPTLGDVFVGSGGGGYAGFANEANGVVARHLGECYVDALALTQASSSSLGGVSFLARATSLATPCLPDAMGVVDRLLVLSRIPTEKSFVQLGYPKTPVSAHADPTPRRKAARLEDASLSTPSPVPPEPVAIDVTGFNLEAFETDNVIRLFYDLDGESFESEAFIVPGNPILPIIHLVYELGEEEVVADVVADCTTHATLTTQLFDVPATYFGELYEFFPLEGPVLFDSPVAWRVQQVDETRRVLQVDVFPVQYNKTTGEATVRDDLSISIQSTTHSGGIDAIEFDKAFYCTGDTAGVQVEQSGGDLLAFYVDGEELAREAGIAKAAVEIPTASLEAGAHSLLCRLYSGSLLVDEKHLSFVVADSDVVLHDIVVPSEVVSGNALEGSLVVENNAHVPAEGELVIRLFNSASALEEAVGPKTIAALGSLACDFSVVTGDLDAGPVWLEAEFKTEGDTFSSALTSIDIEARGFDVRGDVNDSGTADAVDIQLVINAVLNLEVAWGCDLSGDGKLGAVDVQLAINAVLGVG